MSLNMAIMQTEMKYCENVVRFGFLAYENIAIDTKMKVLSLLLAEI